MDKNKKVLGSLIGFLIGLIIGFFSFVSIAFDPQNTNMAIVVYLIIIVVCTVLGGKEGKKFSK